MSRTYYDAVVMGTSLGPLAAGALLAKRGFRVLVAGHTFPLDTYRCGRFTFEQQPLLLESSQTPIFKRIIEELGLAQQLAQVIDVDSKEPQYQVVLPNARVDFFTDHLKTEGDILRELRLPLSHSDTVFRHLGRLCGEMDTLFSGDWMIGATSFLKKREALRAQVLNPFLLHQTDPVPTLIGHPDPLLWRLLTVAQRYYAAGSLTLNTLPQCRQMASLLFHVVKAKSDRNFLGKLLCNAVTTHGGEVAMDQSLSGIAVHRKAVSAVRMVGSDEWIHCHGVLTDQTPKELSSLIAPQDWTESFKWLVDSERAGPVSYVVNLAVDKKVIPAGMAQTVFLSLGEGIKDELVKVSVLPQDDGISAAINLSCIVPAGQQELIYSQALRDVLLDRARTLMPFLDSNLKLIHSPCDRQGPIVFPGWVATPAIDPLSLPRQRVWPVRLPGSGGSFGIEGFPCESGIKGLLLADQQSVSGLGSEGALLAAWNAVRVLGKRHPTKPQVVQRKRIRIEL